MATVDRPTRKYKLTRATEEAAKKAASSGAPAEVIITHRSSSPDLRQFKGTATTPDQLQKETVRVLADILRHAKRASDRIAAAKALDERMGWSRKAGDMPGRGFQLAINIGAPLPSKRPIASSANAHAVIDITKEARNGATATGIPSKPNPGAVSSE